MQFADRKSKTLSGAAVVFIVINIFRNIPASGLVPTNQVEMKKYQHFLFYLVCAISLSYYYLGQYRSLAFVGYLACGYELLRTKRLKLLDALVLAYLLLKLGDSMLQTSALVGLLYGRLYWGFVLFYFFCRDSQLSLSRVLIGLSAIAVLEYFLILMVPGAIGYLPNYQIQDVLFDYYQSSGALGGAHAFGGNRTVSGVLLLAIFCYFDRNGMPGKWLVLVASLVCFSGLAWILAAFYLIIRYFSYSWKIIFSSIPAGAVILLLLGGEDLFYRASYGYASDVIFEYKAEQIEKAFDIIDGDLIYIFFGRHVFETESLEVAGYGLTFGDFLFLEFFMNYGVLGCLVFFTFIFSKINRRNFWMIFFIVVGTFHYHVAYSMPGQFLLGYFLSRQVNKSSSNRYS